MSARPMAHDVDILVVGTGIAGLTFALQAARHGEVLIVTKKERAESNTNYARGGIAAGMGPDDDPDLHLRDTLEAGAGLCHPEVVEAVVREGPARVRELIDWGVRFHHEGGRLSFGMEGGHSRRRIVHAGDRTGREIERALLQAVEEEERIHVVEDVLVVDFLLADDPDGPDARCVGVRALEHRTGRDVELRAPLTFLASGGCGQVYRHTTNPVIATGDGVAMASRAGVILANMEFIQFHPTALYPPGNPAFLISEAIRGEGAILRRIDGTPFMERYHPRGSLAARDLVARAIHAEMQATGDPHVVLDLSPIDRTEVEARFPGAVEGCRERGVDLFGEGIPVVPAAHYACGGIVTDLAGRTSLRGLRAAGEVACTGLHGANRLASNSLLEAVVVTHGAAIALEEEGFFDGRGETAVGDEGSPPKSPEPAYTDAEAERLPVIAELRERLGRVMWDGVGVVRSDAGLAGAAEAVEELRQEAHRAGIQAETTVEAVELGNLLETARLITGCAIRRRESRGLHYNVDHPEPLESFRTDTIITPRDSTESRSRTGLPASE